MRVYDLARNLGTESKTVIARAQALGLDIDHASDALTDDEQAALRGAFAVTETPAETPAETPTSAETAPEMSAETPTGELFVAAETSAETAPETAPETASETALDEPPSGGDSGALALLGSYVLARRPSLSTAGGDCAVQAGESVDADTWAALPEWARDHFDRADTGAA